MPLSQLRSAYFTPLKLLKHRAAVKYPSQRALGTSQSIFAHKRDYGTECLDLILNAQNGLFRSNGVAPAAVNSCSVCKSYLPPLFFVPPPPVSQISLKQPWAKSWMALHEPDMEEDYDSYLLAISEGVASSKRFSCGLDCCQDRKRAGLLYPLVFPVTALDAYKVQARNIATAPPKLLKQK